MKFRALIIIGLCALPATTRAQDIDPQFFTGWNSVNDLLHSRNVDVNRADWTSIERMCLPLKTPDDETVYYRCLYDKALDESEFRQHRFYCEDSAEDLYPDSLMNPRQRTFTETDSTGKYRTVTENVPLYSSEEELKAARRTSFRECMRIYDWRDPNDWKSGRRPEFAPGHEEYPQSPNSRRL
jgi:hypothetical protein